LGSVLGHTEKITLDMEQEPEDAGYDLYDAQVHKPRTKQASRMTGNMENLSGGAMMTYAESSTTMKYACSPIANNGHRANLLSTGFSSKRIKRDDRAAQKAGKGARHEIFRKDLKQKPPGRTM
jgi:hypothetical protein